MKDRIKDIIQASISVKQQILQDEAMLARVEAKLWPRLSSMT